MCACVPALKALAVRVIPKFVLSDLYGGRSKGPYVQQTSGTDGSRAAGDTSVSAASRKREQITVQQSIELINVSTEQAVREREADEDGERHSQDGSERDLVDWRADC